MTKNSIVLVPFPFNERHTSKVRPAVCLTNKIGKQQHVILSFIASKIPENTLHTDIILRKDAKLFHGTGLFTDSVIMLHRMVTLPESYLLRRLGFANPELVTIINRKLKLLFEFK